MRFHQVILLVSLLLAACETTMPSDLSITPGPIWAPDDLPIMPAIDVTPTLSYSLPPVRVSEEPYTMPTPDDPHYLISDTHEEEQYIVQRGDILSAIADKFKISLEAIIEVNHLTDPDSLEVGQILIIPAGVSRPIGPDNKIIPDSELVFGPLANNIVIKEFITQNGGYLSRFSEEVHGEILSGSDIVLRIAEAYSINPRLLIALLEYKSGWLTNPSPYELVNPFGYLDDWYIGLYRQLAWAAIQLNYGFYGWRAGIVTDWLLPDGTIIPIATKINSGTAGVQNFLAQFGTYESWLNDVSPGGFFDVYYLLFGNPFDYSIEPLIPLKLLQPLMQLPFQEGTWSFTGGPHFSWDAGTPFGALDFAPPGEALGCVTVDDWVTAVADGRVIRTGEGVVILDLDLDGNEGTGWVVLYMHIENRDRVHPGAFLRAGDPIGHPSCEGGESSGTHVHLARKFNGAWISADGTVPFNLDGWVSSGTGEEYVGSMIRGEQVVVAYEGNSTINLIQR